jgi:hypothetical protein
VERDSSINTMTKSQFQSLSLEEQDAFVNGGGVISEDPVVPVKVEKPSVVANSTEIKVEDQTPQDTIVSLASKIDSSTQSDLLFIKGFDILNPVTLLLLLDDNISSGRVKLHEWQKQAMVDFAENGLSDKSPFQAIIRACNSSGKDKFIIAPCVVWLCMRYKKTIGVVTSASGVQLDNQTCRYIKALCESANRVFGLKLWDCKYRHYRINFGEGEEGNDSYIFCYATDEPGKAEGYHPIDYGCRMGIFVSEDKTVPDEINVALNKCVGYTHRMHVSTPGLPIGHFFDYCNLSINRKDVISLKELKPTDWVQYHVKASDCSHLSASYIEQMKRDLPGGEFGSAFASQVNAEFGSTDEMVVIPTTFIWQAMQGEEYLKKNWGTVHIPEEFNTGGLDLSDGVAETSLTVRNGNKHLKTIPFKFDNTEDTIEYLQTLFEENGLKHSKALIFADCVGLGKPILDRLKRIGWLNIRYIDSRASSIRPKTFRNRATELWFNTKKFLERHELILQKCNVLSSQLSNRRYKLLDGAVHAVLTKQEQRSKGYPSPDRADSLNLAFWNYQSTFKEIPDDFKDEDKPFEIEEEKETKTKGIFDLRTANSEPKWIANNGQKNFSYLLEEISDYNKRKVTCQTQVK